MLPSFANARSGFFTFWLLIALMPLTPLSAQNVIITRLSSAETRVEAITQVQTEEGVWISETNGYVQLATGQNYWDQEKQSWEPTVEEITLAKIGAVAFRGPQKVVFAPTLDDPNGTLDVLTPDGQRLRSAVLALCYLDPVSGKRVTVGLVRDVTGELIPPNQVIYRSAFASPDNPAAELAVDVVYTYRQSGTEQDVVFRKRPVPPEAFGFSSLVARLEVLTEFYEAPAPTKITHLLDTVEDPVLRARVAAPDWVDEHLDFGGFLLGEGRAFQPSEGPFMRPGPEGGALVGKQWIEEGHRRVLSESVEYRELEPMLQDLAPQDEAAVSAPDPHAQWALNTRTLPWEARLELAAAGTRASGPGRQPALLPERQNSTAQLRRAPMQMAMAREGLSHSPKSVRIDYLPLVTDLTNYVFRGDETYFVTNIVNLRGTTTIEGGTVIKYDPYYGGGPVPQLTVLGPLVCATSAYRPAVFTSRDDQSVGQRIAGSLDNPAAGYFYGIHALWFQTDPSSVLLEHVRFRYSGHAVLFTQRSGTVRHAQFQYCQYPVYGDRASGLKVHNMLATALVSGGAPFKPYNTTTMTGEHVTVCNAQELRYPDASATLTLRNTILAAVTNIQTYGGRNDPLYGNAESTSAAGVFQTIGAGAYYLANGSTHRNVGVTTIDSQLASQLRSLTTFPPEVRTTHFTSNTTLAPSANVARDTDTPDRGYHYVPLDYCLSSIALTNATLTLTNGVALGMYGPKGLILKENARLTSEGSPTLLNRVVRFNTVQEGTNNWGNAPTNSFSLLEVGVLTPYLGPALNLRFTEFSHLAITTNSTSTRRLLDAGSANLVRPLALSHCQLRGVYLNIVYAGSSDQTIALTNNFFEGSVATFQGLSGYGADFLYAYNNLFRGGSVTFNNQDASYPWTIKDNLFDTDALSASTYFTASNNGFRGGLTAFGSNNKTGLAAAFVWGPLGRYYYPRTGGAASLTNLIDAGSRLAGTAGLYQFTTQTDQAKEAGTTVDIGYHYAATGPIVQGLVGCWRLDEGSGVQATDSSLNAFHGTLVNGAQRTYGIAAGAVAFDGVDDQVSVPSNSALQFTAPFTIAFWYQKFTERPDWVRLVGKGGNSFRNYGVWDDSGASRRPLFQFQNTLGEWKNLSGTYPLTTNRWYHLVCTWDGAVGRIYIDGKLDISGPMTGTPKTSADPLTFGYAGVASALNGVVDEVGLFNRALNSVEVLSLMQGTAVDTDGEGLPDYFEDRNGDGLTNALETSVTSADTDGDSQNDWEEYSEGTSSLSAADRLPTRLAYFRFDTPSLTGEEGEAPLQTNLLQWVDSLEGNSVQFSTGGAVLRYPCIEPNGRVNLHPGSFGVRLWFRPNWTSACAGGTNAPVGEVSLLTVGDPIGNPGAGFLDACITSNGDQIRLRSSDGATVSQAISLVLSNYVLGPFLTATWHELLFGVGPDRLVIWKDGRYLTNVVASLSLASSNLMSGGYYLGSRANGTAVCQGSIDEVEIYNYPLESNAIRETGNLLYAESLPDQPAIRLNYRQSPSGLTSIQVERRLLGATNGFSNGWTVLSSQARWFSYTNPIASADVGKLFEYRVRARNNTYVEDHPSLPGLVAAIEAPPVLKRGRVLLLIDSTIAGSIAAELSQFVSNLRGDGWIVASNTVPRHDDLTWSLNTNNIQNVIKPLIRSHWSAYTNAPPDEQLKALVLIGHVAIPYTGMAADDGHTGRGGDPNDNHIGAWSSDFYYADMDGVWQDQLAYNAPGNPPLAPRYPITTNYIGDGKFDDLLVPPGITGSRLEMCVGRIDFARQPAFTNPPTSLNEVGLLKRYFDKNHRFRHGQTPVTARSVGFNSWTRAESLLNNYGDMGHAAFAIGRVCPSGPARLAESSVFGATNSLTYLWGYHCWQWQRVQNRPD